MKKILIFLIGLLAVIAGELIADPTQDPINNPQPNPPPDPQVLYQQLDPTTHTEVFKQLDEKYGTEIKKDPTVNPGKNVEGYPSY